MIGNIGREIFLQASSGDMNDSTTTQNASSSSSLLMGFSSSTTTRENTNTATNADDTMSLFAGLHASLFASSAVNNIDLFSSSSSRLELIKGSSWHDTPNERLNMKSKREDQESFRGDRKRTEYMQQQDAMMMNDEMMLSMFPNPNSNNKTSSSYDLMSSGSARSNLGRAAFVDAFSTEPGSFLAGLDPFASDSASRYLDSSSSMAGHGQGFDLYPTLPASRSLSSQFHFGPSQQQSGFQNSSPPSSLQLGQQSFTTNAFGSIPGFNRASSLEKSLAELVEALNGNNPHSNNNDYPPQELNLQDSDKHFNLPIVPPALDTQRNSLLGIPESKSSSTNPIGNQRTSSLSERLLADGLGGASYPSIAAPPPMMPYTSSDFLKDAFNETSGKDPMIAPINSRSESKSRIRTAATASAANRGGMYASKSTQDVPSQQHGTGDKRNDDGEDDDEDDDYDDDDDDDEGEKGKQGDAFFNALSDITAPPSQGNSSSRNRYSDLSLSSMGFSASGNPSNARMPTISEVKEIVSNIEAPKPRTQTKPPKKWTEEEDKALLAAVAQHGAKNWKLIALSVPGRTHTQCLQRYNKALRPDLVHGAFSKEEDAIILKSVEEQLKSTGTIIFKKIRDQGLPSRTTRQIRERYQSSLSPEVKKSSFTTEEDMLILSMQMEFGNCWAHIARHLDGRTEHAVKTRFKSLSKKIEKLFSPEADEKLLHLAAKANEDWDAIGNYFSGHQKAHLMVRHRQLQQQRKR